MVEHLHRIVRSVRPGRARTRRERGSVVIVAMLVLVALISLGGLTVLSVQGSASATGADRFKAIALYAAESGASAAMDYMRKHIGSGGKVGWTDYVSANNGSPQSPVEIPGNGVLPGDDGNLFTPEMNAWYEVTILNNPTDLGFATPEDKDKRIILLSTGHGPNGAVAQVEWEIASSDPTMGRPCPTYGQKGMAEDGAGRNDCLTAIESTNTATYRPGD